MDSYFINKKDLNSGYFHFTYKRNLESIMSNGLVPTIGNNSKNVERTKKVFFTEGLDNLLILFDVWIRSLYYIPVIPLIYKLGAFFLRQKWFPNIIGDSYFKVLKVSKLHQKRAFKRIDKFLDYGILLKLDLEENVDFRYDDRDEVKSSGYIKRHLEICGYSEEYSNLNSNIMDKWNLHCLSNHTVDKKKIKICYLENNSSNLRDIFNYLLKNTTIDLKKVCPELSAYLKYKNYEGVQSGKE